MSDSPEIVISGQPVDNSFPIFETIQADVFSLKKHAEKFKNQLKFMIEKLNNNEKIYDLKNQLHTGTEEHHEQRIKQLENQFQKMKAKHKKFKTKVNEKQHNIPQDFEKRIQVVEASLSSQRLEIDELKSVKASQQDEIETLKSYIAERETWPLEVEKRMQTIETVLSSHLNHNESMRDEFEALKSDIAKKETQSLEFERHIQKTFKSTLHSQKEHNQSMIEQIGVLGTEIEQFRTEQELELHYINRHLGIIMMPEYYPKKLTQELRSILKNGEGLFQSEASINQIYDADIQLEKEKQEITAECNSKEMKNYLKNLESKNADFARRQKLLKEESIERTTMNQHLKTQKELRFKKWGKKGERIQQYDSMAVAGAITIAVINPVAGVLFASATRVVRCLI